MAASNELICVDAELNECDCDAPEAAYQYTRADLKARRKALGLPDAPAGVKPKGSAAEAEPPSEGDDAGEEVEDEQPKQPKAKGAPAQNKAKSAPNANK